MPFIDAFLEQISRDISRDKCTGRKYYLAFSISLDFAGLLVLQDEVAIANKVVLAAEITLDSAAM